MDTDDFIESLVEDGQPVRRLKPPWFRAGVWLALGLSPVFLIAVVDGLPVEAAFVDRQSIIEPGAVIATAAAAAIAAFAATIPGASKRWLLLPLVPLAVWLPSVEEVCVPSWMRFAFENLGPLFDSSCFLPIVLLSAFPTVMMLVMLRRGAPAMPRVALLFGTFAIAGLTNFGLLLVHGPDASFMVLAWTFAVMALVSATAAVRGRPLLGWPKRSS